MSAGGRLLWPVAVVACLFAVAAGSPVAQIGTLTVPADSLAGVWDPSTVKPIRALETGFLLTNGPANTPSNPKSVFMGASPPFGD